MNISRISISLLLVFLLVLQSIASAQKTEPAIPDFTQGDKIPQGHNHDWNLGPTGARGWIYSHKLETTQARQILITKVERGSPSYGILNKGDVILGIGGHDFQIDPRVEFGKAITEAETKSGDLLLSIWRDGKTVDVSLSLKVLGSYSKNAPLNCDKSLAIFERGCDALAMQMKEKPDGRNGIVRAYNTLALLASGREKFMPVIKKQIEWAADFSDVQGKSLCCWYYGPINLLLAEYTLATGDKTYLPDLRRISMEIVNGQSQVGTWGHRFARTDGRLNGYGMMNAPGLPMTLSLILARKAGVSDPQLDDAIAKSVRLMRFYVGKGCVPYGDHAPWTETHDDNGKNGIAAVMFNVLEDQEAAEYFSRMSIASHGAEREMGHTGNFFNILWAMPGVAVSGMDASGAWLAEYGWYYDLARRWDGTFRHQGPAQPRHDSYKNWDATGVYLLAYAQSSRKLYITGKQTGVATQIDATIAKNLMDDGRGYSHRQKNKIYSNKTDDELLTALTSWSPVVRERAATALSKRGEDVLPKLKTHYETHRPPLGKIVPSKLHVDLGFCQAVEQLGPRAAAFVPEMRELLRADDLWLRIKAADALAAIGKPARIAIPELLKMLVQKDAGSDPRRMQQRFVSFALFNRRGGLLSGSLEGVDREALYEAVRAGLQNEDGRARAAFDSVYRNLSYNEIKPLLRAIHRAVAESAPSGMMFADGIRLSGLEILAKHRIQEGLPLCIELLELDRWGSDKRIPKCLKSLQHYGAAAKPLLAKLDPLKSKLESKKRKNDNDKRHLKLLYDTVEKIQSSKAPPKLRSISENEV
jgi:HEAT repeat protein